MKKSTLTAKIAKLTIKLRSLQEETGKNEYSILNEMSRILEWFIKYIFCLYKLKIVLICKSLGVKILSFFSIIFIID